MTSLHRLNALQNELRDTLSLTDDYKLDVSGDDVRANFIGLQLRSVFHAHRRCAPHFIRPRRRNERHGQIAERCRDRSAGRLHFRLINQPVFGV